MIDSAAIRTILCDAFSKEVSVNRVPCGLAISTSFVDASGDPLGFYLIETKTVSGPGYYFVDGGDYLPHLAASGIDLESGQPARLLDRILSGTGTFWDKETWEIRSTIFTEADLAPRAYRFLSALIRVRDLECLENGIEVNYFTE